VENSDSLLLEEYLSGLKDFLDILIFKYPTSNLLKELQEQRFVDIIITKTLKKESPATSEYMDILMRLFQICVNTGQYETVMVPPLISTILNQEGKEKRGGGGDSSNSVFPLQKLFQVLYKPSTILPPTITTTAGIVAPLGSFRLKCVQLVLLLLKSNFLLLDTALVEYKIIARCVDLFFQFKWNNILHAAVEAITRYIFGIKATIPLLTFTERLSIS